MGKNLPCFCARTTLDQGGNGGLKKSFISRKGRGQNKVIDKELAQELNVRQILYHSFKTRMHSFELVCFALCKIIPLFPSSPFLPQICRLVTSILSFHIYAHLPTHILPFCGRRTGRTWGRLHENRDQSRVAT